MSIDQSNSEIGYEKEDVNIPYIVLFAIVCLSSIILGVIGVDNYFIHTKETLLQEMNRSEPIALKELRAKEIETLTTYKILDEKNEIYRIPIKRAMKLVSEESFEKDTKNQNEE